MSATKEQKTGVKVEQAGHVSNMKATGPTAARVKKREGKAAAEGISGAKEKEGGAKR